MNVTNFSSYEKMSLFAAEFVVFAMKKKDKFVLGLPTGSTPLGLYKELIRRNSSGEISFNNVVTFNLDEYYPIKCSDPQSYCSFMQENLFRHINIKPENINIPNGEVADIDKECAEYDEKIKMAGGIDLMILGLGGNGHIGFNEPGQKLEFNTHHVELAEKTRQANTRFFASIDDVPTHAVTMGIGSIMMCKELLVIVTGEAKKDALKQILNKEITTQNPGTVINLHRNVTLLTDLDV